MNPHHIFVIITKTLSRIYQVGIQMIMDGYLPDNIIHYLFIIIMIVKRYCHIYIYLLTSN